MTLKDDFAAKSPLTFVYGADGRVCATQRRISSSAVPLYSALMGLNSPRLPKVISVREDDEGAVVTEGYIDGVTLRRALDNGRLGEDELRRLAIDICSALSLLHSSRPPIIHRDIKPENIICADGGGYVLIDFDASRLFKPEANSDTVTLGTNGYAAPEQYSAAEFSGRYTDVYALAAVCYRMVTGQTPVAAPQRKVRDSLESAHSLEAGVPTWFSQVLACALRLDPAKRMQTVPELMSALTDPNVANAMFEKGDNQISTRKIMAVSLVVIFVLVVLLLWSLIGGSKADSTPVSTPQPTAAGTAVETTAETVPNLVGLRYTTDIKGNSAYDDYRIVMVEQSSDTVAQGVVISQDPPAGSEKLMDDQIIQITVSSGPSLVEMPDIIGFTQANASKKLDALGIQYKMVMVDNDGTMAAGCVASTDYKAGTKINTENVTVIVSIAGERDDTLVAQTGNAAESNSASPEGETVTEGD